MQVAGEMFLHEEEALFGLLLRACRCRASRPPPAPARTKFHIFLYFSRTIRYPLLAVRCSENRGRRAENMEPRLVSIFPIILRIGTISSPRISADPNGATAVHVNSAGVCSSFSGSTCPPTSPATRLPTEAAGARCPSSALCFRGEEFRRGRRPAGLSADSPRSGTNS